MLTKIDYKNFLDNNEYGYVIEKNNAIKNGSKIKTYIPKIMSGINKGTPISTVKSVTSNAFINASSCKVKVASSVKTRNYIECELETKATNVTIEKNTKLECSTINGNIQKITVKI